MRGQDRPPTRPRVAGRRSRAPASAPESASGSAVSRPLSPVGEALFRHATVDPRASAREQIGAQIGLLGMILAIILVGALPVAEAVRVPFLTVAFVAAFYVGLAAKRALDDWWDR